MMSDPHADIVLPPQYGQALQLAESMLTAAHRGNWDEVRRLRGALPGMARDLEIAWQELRSVYPDACALLEGKRARMIREILRVDEQIRQLGTPAYRRMLPWLATRPMLRPASPEPCVSRV